jgi:hypothetical protein
MQMVPQRHAALMALKRISSFRQFLRILHMEECPLGISNAKKQLLMSGSW